MPLSRFLNRADVRVTAGEGNGNPLQCSCLENPRDRGAWWADIYGVTQSRTRLKRLSSSSNSKGHRCRDGQSRSMSPRPLDTHCTQTIPDDRCCSYCPPFQLRDRPAAVLRLEPGLTDTGTAPGHLLLPPGPWGSLSRPYEEQPLSRDRSPFWPRGYPEATCSNSLSLI